MKKLFAMFLAVMLVVTLAGGAMAITMEEIMGLVGCDCNPDLPDSGTVQVTWETVGLTGLWVSGCVEICAVIGCGEFEGCEKTFPYQAIATGCDCRKIVGKLQSPINDANIQLQAKLSAIGGGTSTGWQTMTTTNKDLVGNLSKMCLADGTGAVRLVTAPDACETSGCSVLQLTIMDCGTPCPGTV